MTYVFDEFELDTVARELRCGGDAIKVEPKVFDFLEFIIRNRDQVSSKDKLVETLWQGRFVSDAAISSCISAARKALGDDGHQQRYIRTVHGRGVRFVAQIRERSKQTDREPFRAASAEVKVAVLPFLHLTTYPAAEGLGKALSASVTTELSRFKHFTLQAIDDSQDGATPSSELELGKALRADFIVSGSVHILANRIRVTAQLIDCEGDKHVWAERFDGAIDDTFNLIDNASRSIAATAAGRINAMGHMKALGRNLSELDVDELVRRAQANYNHSSKEAFLEAMPLLEQAIEIDPQNTWAHMLLGAFYDMAYWTGWMENPEQCLKRAIEYGQKAVQLDPTDSLAHAHLGEALLHAERITESKSHYDRALRLNPNDVAARTLYAAFLTATGNPEGALKQLDSIQDLDPFGLNWIPWMRADACFDLGRFDDAIAALQEFDYLINNARILLAACYAHIGRLEDARRTLKEFLSIAEREMARTPKTLQEWRTFLVRESSAQNSESYDALIDGLLLAGLDKFSTG